MRLQNTSKCWMRRILFWSVALMDISFHQVLSKSWLQKDEMKCTTYIVMRNVWKADKREFLPTIQFRQKPFERIMNAYLSTFFKVFVNHPKNVSFTRKYGMFQFSSHKIWRENSQQQFLNFFLNFSPKSLYLNIFHFGLENWNVSISIVLTNEADLK